MEKQNLFKVYPFIYGFIIISWVLAILFTVKKSKQKKNSSLAS
ncbi:hypothetical protein [Peribacillus asahii]